MRAHIGTEVVGTANVMYSEPFILWLPRLQMHIVIPVLSPCFFIQFHILKFFIYLSPFFFLHNYAGVIPYGAYISRVFNFANFANLESFAKFNSTKT